MATTRVNFENEAYTGEELDEAEQNLLLRQLYEDVAGESAILNKLFRDSEQKVIAAAQVAKHTLDAPFRGMFAGDSEFGLQLIRPSHLLRTTSGTETPQNDWTFTFTADSDYWIGYNTNNTTAINIDKRLLLLILALGWTQGGAPSVEELYPQIGGTTYPVQVIRHGWLADNASQVRVARIRPWLLVPKQTLLVQVYSILAQTQQMVAIGLAFAKGDLMRTQAPSSVQV